MRNKLAFLDYIVKDRSKIIEIINCPAKINIVKKSIAERYVKSLECDFLTIFDKNYPQKLKLLVNHPLVVYYIGNISLLDDECITMLSDWYPTRYAYEVGKNIIVNNNVFISESESKFGKFITHNAHYFKKKSIVIYQDGFVKNDVHSEDLSLFISSPGTNSKAEQYDLQMINIVLSSKVVVVQSAVNSKINKLVDLALLIDNQIYSVPADLKQNEFEGNVRLICEGANVVEQDFKI